MVRALSTAALLVGSLAMVTGCDDPEAGVNDPGTPVNNCIDADGDGYGENCDLGLDCDDNDPLRALSCEATGQDLSLIHI